MKQITNYVARHAGHDTSFVLMGRESMDEARKYLEEMGFVGYVYEEVYNLVSTTPHIVGDIQNVPTK